MITAVTIAAVFLLLTFAAWRRYLSVATSKPLEETDTCPYSLTEIFGETDHVNVPHQKGVRWLTDVFSRSVNKYPHLTALQVPYTNESLTYAELDQRAETIAAALETHVNGPDQVVAVAMSQDNADIVASHLGILKAGGTLMFLDTTLPDELITHMLNDAQPVAILTRGEKKFRDIPTVDVLALPGELPRRKLPTWLDDPKERLAAIFYTSGTTGTPRGVECPHAGYVNLALSYADYFDLIPGMDATSLTSSLGYDGSISEMYCAWVSGCSVVLLTKEQVRSGPDLIPILCEAEVTTLFCPPVLLTTLTQNPETDLPYPICRYIVPAGEAFPSALVEPWTRNRRQIINTYGPTEASTDTSRQSLRPGEPITIGSPLPNVTYVILEIDELAPLKHGEIGELCIGGVHVARGYRNLPEQTAKKFIVHPQFGRLYRTGDKCRIDPKTFRVDFLGRIDAQLKVRGHRVEAQAVEDILQTQFAEIEAAVLDYQNDALVAFVAAPSISRKAISPAPADWAARVTATLTRQLPEPSIPTSIFVVEKFSMKAVSGKIDRRCLPDLSQISLDTLGNGHDLRSVVEDPAMLDVHEPAHDADRDAVLTICRAVFGMPIGLDDGFAESGGHSIVIARLAQQLKKAGWTVSVKALLSDCNTARRIVERGRLNPPEPATNSRSLRNEDTGETRDEAAAKVLSVGYFTTLQILFSIFLYIPAIATFIFALSEVEDLGFPTAVSFWECLLGSISLYIFALATPFLLLLWAMIVKFFLGGDTYRNNTSPGIYPKWSRMHLRVWCIERIQKMVLVPLGALYRSAPIRAFVLRQLGATVGSNLQCANDVYLTGPLDLIIAEDDVAIQTGSYIQTVGWSGEILQVGPVHLGRGCKIGMRSTISNSVTVGAGAWITPLTPILSDVGSHEVWEGAPAVASGSCIELERTRRVTRYDHPVWLLETLGASMQILFTLLLTVIPVAVILWFGGQVVFPDSIGLTDPDLDVRTVILHLLWPLALYALSTTWVSIFVTSLLDCLFIRFTAGEPGIYPSRGLRAAMLMYRIAILNSLQRMWTWTLTGQYLRAIAGVRFRRVGASECDVMFNLVPEAATADSQVFWSSGSYTNMLDLGAKHFTLRRMDMPHNFFTGNNGVVESGQFPSNFLLGVSTPAGDNAYRRQMRSRPGEPITIAGNPPVRFAASSEEHQSETLPGFPLFLARVFMNDLFSVGTLPVIEGLFLTVVWVAFWRLGVDPVVSAIVGFLMAQIFLIFLCVGVKKLLVGRTWGANHRTPFWSLRHFAYFFAQDAFFAWCRVPLTAFSGTVVANWLLRLMGCEIGKRTIVAQPLQCFDWNAVSFGSDCYIDGYLQLHTFEDMVLKVKRTHVGDGCTVNVGSTVMGGASIESGTTLLSLSLVLKEMDVQAGVYEGSPIQELSAPTALALANRAPAVPAPEVLEEPVSRIVDNTDWLKFAAIILVLIDHFGYFLMASDRWWGVFGRFAAPSFFFLLGYANTRSIPIPWLLLGGILTLLESSNNDWTWVGPNILFSFAIIRFGRPYARKLIEGYGGIAYIILMIGLVAVLPLAAPVVDYGAEGWLWALLGLSQRLWIDGKEQAEIMTDPAPPSRWTANLARILVCGVAAVVYVWQEQKEFVFTHKQWTVLVVGVVVLAICFLSFSRGPSRLKPPPTVARAIRWIGRRTLEIYVIELVVFELIVKVFPSLAP